VKDAHTGPSLTPRQHQVHHRRPPLQTLSSDAISLTDRGVGAKVPALATGMRTMVAFKAIALSPHLNPVAISHCCLLSTARQSSSAGEYP
jgi:sterol desaturase/sphingolipid hydroxylase (fatty acid hydroxylase superfamily)